MHVTRHQQGPFSHADADDAKAQRITFCLDERQHGTASLSAATLAPFQGPALLVHNDALFSETDYASISQIGDSLKRGDAGKTGRFGIGFNSVCLSCMRLMQTADLLAMRVAMCYESFITHSMKRISLGYS